MGKFPEFLFSQVQAFAAYNKVLKHLHLFKSTWKEAVKRINVASLLVLPYAPVQEDGEDALLVS